MQCATASGALEQHATRTLQWVTKEEMAQLPQSRVQGKMCELLASQRAFIRMGAVNLIFVHRMVEICYTTSDLKLTKSLLLNRYRKLDIVVQNPREGEFITVKSYKHDGSLHRTWRDSMILKTSDQAIIACNDHTLVTESDGRRWLTREPALLYYHKHYWFNVVTMIRQKGISYYCNLASPLCIRCRSVEVY